MSRLIKTSELIDGIGESPRYEWGVLVEDGIIADIGPSAKFEGIETEVVDLTDESQ